MGSAARIRPKKLAPKLKSVREKFDLSLSQMADQLSDKRVSITKGEISRLESGQREPSLIILLRYARLAGISTDVLIDDTLNLPK